MQQKTITISNKLGLHARASAKLIETASRFASKVSISKDGQMADAKSIMAVMMLAASCGTEVRLETDGEDEVEAMQAVSDLIDDKFGEGE